MRLSRSNFPGSAATKGEGGDQPADAVPHQDPQLHQQADPAPGPPVVPQAADRHVPDPRNSAASEEAGELPVWQTAFALKPNVRFTRTPENAIAKRPTAATVPAPPAPAVAVRPSAPLPPQIPSAAAVKPQMPHAPRATFEERTIERGLVTRGLPTEAAPGARALVDELRREFVAPGFAGQTAAISGFASKRADAAEARRQLPPSAQAAARPAPTVGIRTTAANPVRNVQAVAAADQIAHLAPHLPDHLFWEAMSLGSDGERSDFDGTDQPPATAPAARPRQPASVARRDTRIESSQVPASPVMDVEDGSPVLRYRAFTLRSASQQIEPPAFIEPYPVAETVEAYVAPPAVERVAKLRQNTATPLPSRRASAMQTNGPLPPMNDYELPSSDLLQEPQGRQAEMISQEALEQSAGLLESVLEDFGIKGEIVDVRPGPVVTLYEFEPAPGVKSSRVIGLSEDIARSMSALSARVAVIPGRNVIGIELPNPVRETVYFREMIESENYERTGFSLPLCLGKTIGGEPVIADLAKMPHLLVAGTTGSGKSVSVNTMILSLLYRLRPDECRLIMVDPKMLELSIYDGIPHLLTPVVTDPKKAVLALKWAVREMEDRYRKMSRLGVRNIDGYNARVAAARDSGETIMISVQIGFDRSTGEPLHEEQEMDLAALPYIVIIVDEMADLMMVAGKDIEGAIQRLAQMARAAGIHLIMATQRPSVDVITGTIKANFPTRISFQVTSKIDSRTILGEQGAENLLGQGDMLHMVGGGRIARVHGPFVSDHEVEAIVAHLKNQGRPQYLGTVTEDADEPDSPEEDCAVFDKSSMGEDDGDDLYDRAVKIVLRDKKCSTSYIQRRLSIGYNRAASLVERMEQEGLVGPANHVGKRAIIVGGQEIHSPEMQGGEA
jgi:S-DNA-T family DNA segregation ATPase FtsK/SpoIIIE